MPRNHFRVFCLTISVLLCFTLTGCGHNFDFYKKRADMIRTHSEAFQVHLKANQIAAAIYENEEIEATASEVAASIRKRGKPLPKDQVDYEWRLLKTAIDTALKNWLALGRQLTMDKKYDQARAAYQRILDTYTGEAEQPYRERAARAKRDIDILNPPVSVSAPNL